MFPSRIAPLVLVGLLLLLPACGGGTTSQEANPTATSGAASQGANPTDTAQTSSGANPTDTAGANGAGGGANGKAVQITVLTNFTPDVARGKVFNQLIDQFNKEQAGKMWGVALVYAGISFPLGFLIIKTYMDTIPHELVEAARIDGASYHRVFLNLILPLTVPGIVTAAIFLMITAWNELLFASILTQDERAQTVQVGIRFFLTTYAANYPQAFAATVMAILPTIAVYIFLSDRVIEGMTAGSLK